ncbi:hypothetical protein [Candidatus Thioglobus sp.]|jgi:hypothetical protein|uniref:hypothetical protein n=1 Tax=Candidatus Thioglobus sp. TaxID=2026721 RepID=UPI0025C4F9F8|nr:hypothetical protein [Candidatus Thioglobus sp.]
MSNKTTTNLANFIPKGELGQLFVKARAYNLINNKLISLLPSPLKTLSLCVVEDNVATLVTSNQAVAFRAQKQCSELLSIIQTLEGLSHIQKITIKVNFKEY